MPYKTHLQIPVHLTDPLLIYKCLPGAGPRPVGASADWDLTVAISCGPMTVRVVHAGLDGWDTITSDL